VPDSAGSRRPKDEDFIETQEGLLFRVLGYLHPPDGYTAYLHYDYDRAEPAGTRSKAGYRKIPHRFNAAGIAGTIRYLENHHPHYVVDDPVQGVRLSVVPRRRVRRYLLPEARLAAVSDRPRDPLETLVQELAASLAAASGVPLSALGVTGSVLASIHDPQTSDIDLVSYGREPARRLKQALLRQAPAGVQPVEDERLRHWVWEFVHDFPLTRAEAHYLVDRRWNCGRFGGRFFSLWAARTDEEITEIYGERSYRSLGPARVRAVVVDIGDAIFLPATYGVHPLAVTSGPDVHITQIVTYDMRFVDAFESGMTIEAMGRVETTSDGIYRLVIGSEALAGRDYFRPLG